MLSDKPNSRFENFMHESVQLGSKATVSAGCIVGKGSVLGDKCSVKRSIIGSTCKLGNNVKIMSSIVMDDVIVEEGSHIQNSIICSGSHLKVCNCLSRFTVVSCHPLQRLHLAQGFSCHAQQHCCCNDAAPLICKCVWHSHTLQCCQLCHCECQHGDHTPSSLPHCSCTLVWHYCILHCCQLRHC